MKKTRSRSQSTAPRKVVCTVSAAALMLGVSQAATIGLHFQVDYCTSGGTPNAAYSGYPVTVTAFGIPTNQWENLIPMATGYQGCCGPLGYSTNEVIDTDTSTNGLNPLANGSLTVTWFGPTANYSDFGGYAAGGAHYDLPGGGYPNSSLPVNGESEIYLSFLRDGLNFGPAAPAGTCPNGGAANNDQPGWNVDITGLKSLFTNTPFAIEMIASADSMNVLTNVFIIDAVANTTQSVVYPNTPPVNNTEGQLWTSGSGGGLSTGSGSFNTDHIKIMSNHPQHDTVSGAYNNAGTVSGFIITDKPVVTMSPRPVPIGPGDTVTWSAYAVGVPPLAYQWLKNGSPIPGATTLSYGITNAGAASLGNYALRVTNLYGSATSSVVSVDHIVPGPVANVVADSSTAGAEHDGIDIGASWLASSTDGGGIARTGVMSFNAGASGQITVAPFTSFNSPTGTIAFWVRSSLAIGSTFTNPATLFDRLSGGLTGTGLVITENTAGSIFIEAGSDAVFYTSSASIADGNWHHIAVVYDQSNTGQTSLYVDGALDGASPAPNNAAWSWPSAEEIELGLSHDTTDFQQYNGLMDDFRVYSRTLTGAEIASIHTSNALVDTSTLVLQLNFSAAPSSETILTWQITDGILQSAPSVTGPWTDVGATQTQYIVTPDKAAQFYRYRGHTAVTLVTNPYLM
jgi:hypothetical protein